MGRRLLLILALATTIVLCLAAGPAAAVGPTNDPEPQWGFTDIKAPEAWPKGAGANIRVAVVSSGIARHPDLTSKTDGGFDPAGGDPTADVVGSGTHLAGIVGAATNNNVGIAGVAPDARLLPYKAFSDGPVSTPQYLEALQQALNAKHQVVLVDVPDGFPADGRDLLRQSLSNLGRAGISVAVGAKGGLALADLPVLAVAATTAGETQAPGTAGVSPTGVAAPGGGVNSTTVTPGLLGGDPRYDYGVMSGTGQAAAHAAGALAILRSAGANAAQAADLLRTTARKGGDTSFGAGIIDVAAAIAAYRPTAPPATTTTTKKATVTPAPKAPSPSVTIPGPVIPSQPTGPVLSGEPAEPGEGESAVVPPGAEEFYDDEGAGATTTLVSEGDDRPFGHLAVGFGLLFGVGTGLSVTFRRLADLPL